ncbi:MAG: hypothetical protein QOJ90_566 [Actinomycetota bacterium]|nr:hypothetical protein [Actinomycetota bacterium]
MARRDNPNATGATSVGTDTANGDLTRDDVRTGEPVDTRTGDPVVVRHTDTVDGRDRTGVLVDHGRQHARFGGMKWGAAFFGWLSANGLTVLLLAIASAAGVAIGYTKNTTTDEAANNAGTLGVAGGIVLLVILAIGYYAGGYVAGRMARFDGVRQGMAVWLWGLLVTVLLAIAGVAFGAKYNVLSQLNLPRIPVDEGTATTAAVVALVAVLVVTLLASVLGGKAGEHYHRRVDRAGIV